MFDLYDIYDTSEIGMLTLIIIIVLLVFVIIILFIYSHIKNRPIVNDEKPASNVDYDKKYNDLMEQKGEVDVNQVKYSPSEFSTLLKYNPILPYSAFTWDIINNSYLDYNEQSNFDDKYFSLSNYDNIYKTTNENYNSNDNNSENSNIKSLKKKVDNFKNNNNNNPILDESYKKNNI
jgi:hypothetical protein